MNRKLPGKIIKSLCLSTFNKDILISWNSYQCEPVLVLAIGNQHLWHNVNVRKPNGDTLFSHRLSKKGINQVMDLIENQKIISIDDINSKNITMLEKFELASLIKSIPKLWKEHAYDYNHINYVSFCTAKKRYLNKNEI